MLKILRRQNSTNLSQVPWCAEEAAVVYQSTESGEAFAMGDTPPGSVAYAWLEMPVVCPELPNSAACYPRLRSRTAFERGVMTPLT